jgi:glycosyltransferase involved in cell wall biosynthesis
VKILMLHNFYQQPGGEDLCFNAEADLLERHGHAVVRYTQHNDSIRHLSDFAAARKALWNKDVLRELASLIERERPNLMHVHNTFPLISPAAYYAAKKAGVPVVQSIHNYRLFCLSGNLYRAGVPCETCLEAPIPWRGVWHRCYRGDLAASGAVAAMLVMHRLMRTWQTKVDYFVVPLNFVKEKLRQGGIAEEKIAIRPYFAPAAAPAGDGSGDFALFMGRLAPDKGIRTLLRAWKILSAPIKLMIVGDGPLRSEIEAAAAADRRITAIRSLPYDDAMRVIRQARFFILPSEWYEGLPRVIIESFAAGTPIVAAKIGAASEAVTEGINGLHFRPGDAGDLAARVNWLHAQPEILRRMRRNARAEYEGHYTPDRNYHITLDLYGRAIEQSFSSRVDAPAACEVTAKFN